MSEGRKPQASRRLARLAMVLAGLALLAGVAAAAGLWQVYKSFHAAGEPNGERTVIIARGTSLSAAADRLEAEGVITDARMFRLGARLFGGDAPIHAGEYAFAADASMAMVLDKMQAGRVVSHQITFAEGRTTAEYLEILASDPVLVGDIGEAPGEGRLLPETYQFTRGDTRDQIIGRMRAAQDAVLAELWATRAPDLPLATPREALILASIVEKETARPDERAHVAGVFINRLKRGMKLQSDPTVIYGLTGGARLERPLRRKDLRTETPYNTYIINGLPPGPICNPGRAAIEAVLNPLATNDLYFVADGTGGHAFAATLDQHNRNVAKWRQFVRELRARDE